MEGLGLDKCPHIESATSPTRIQTTAPVDETEPVETTPDLPLAKSERLDLEEASAVLRSGVTRVVAIIGPTSSGKTSLIASLCDLFQQGPLRDIQFARSRTFFAFEQACHHARAVSRRSSPETEHTSLASGLGFYHLRVQNRGTGKNYDLLFADRSGEDYRSVSDDPSTAEEFVEIKRADTITALVNGELMLDISARHNVRHEAVMILQGLLNGNVLSKNQRLAVVLTKYDTIKGSAVEDRERTERDFEALVRHIDDRFKSAFTDIHSFKIAASPKSTDLPHGFGSQELLEFWLAPPQGKPVVQPLIQKPTRAIGRFGMETSHD